MFSIQSVNPTPKICLNMIVKNESRVILRLLESVCPFIDGYCICDTGSTDNTVELITEFFIQKNIPGKIIREPFRDFGYNRSFALNACESMPEMDYILLMDADMVLTGDALLTADTVAQFKQSMNTDCYHICQGTPTYFYKNVRIVRNHKGYKYWGVTHEYVQTPSGTAYESIDINSLFIRDIGDGGSKQDKFERDIRLLTKGLEETPNNDRYTFYLANSYRDAGQYEKAIETYKKRIEIGGWVEEVWHSYYNIGHCYRLLGQTEKSIYTWLDAFNFHPRRLEAIYEVISHYRIRGKNRLAYLYYVAAAESQKTWGVSHDYLFLQKDVYDYKLEYELSIIGYYINTNNYDLNRTCMNVLANSHGDESVEKNTLTNYKFYAKKLASQSASGLTVQQMNTLEDATRSLKIARGGPDAEYVSSTPSICARGNYLIVNVRYVNYRIDPAGNYINREKIRTKNAVAIIDVSRDIWKIAQEFELKYDESLDDRYVGLEDIRLLYTGQKIVYNANRGIGFDIMKIENGEIDIAGEQTINSNCLTKPSENRIEKNWVLFMSIEPEIYTVKAIYNWWPNLIIGNIVQDQFVESHSLPVPRVFKYLRGSTNGISIDDELWFICHTVSYEDRRYYYHIMVVLDSRTYAVKRYTPFFTFEGEKVEYTLGFIYSESSNAFLIGYSVYDNTTKYMSVSRTLMEESMIFVKE